MINVEKIYKPKLKIPSPQELQYPLSLQDVEEYYIACSKCKKFIVKANSLAIMQILAHFEETGHNTFFIVKRKERLIEL